MVAERWNWMLYFLRKCLSYWVQTWEWSGCYNLNDTCIQIWKTCAQMRKQQSIWFCFFKSKFIDIVMTLRWNSVVSDLITIGLAVAGTKNSQRKNILSIIMSCVFVVCSIKIVWWVSYHCSVRTIKIVWWVSSQALDCLCRIKLRAFLQWWLTCWA